MGNKKINNASDENSIMSYITLVYRDVQKFPGVGYIVRNADKESTNYGYKALMAEDMSILLETYPKSEDELEKNGTIDFYVCGNLVVKVKITKESDTTYRNSRISNIYRVVKTKSKTVDSDSYSYRLVEVRRVIKTNLMGFKELCWEGHVIAYIARYQYSPKQNNDRRDYCYSYAFNYNMVLYDKDLNPVVFTRDEIKELERMEYSVVSKKFGQSFVFENGTISKMINSSGETVVKIEKSSDSDEYKLIGLV